MILYGDNSEFVSTSLRKHDVFCVGGFLTPLDEVKKIEKVVDNIKLSHEIPLDLPLKWNMKDEKLKRLYKTRSKENEWKNLIRKSKEWREDLLKELSSLKFEIIVSGARKLGVTPKREVCSILFTNLLQRYSLELKNNPDVGPHFLVFDWEDEIRDAYCEIFSDAYHKGSGPKGERFFSGQIKELGYALPYLSFSVCIYNPLLQVADIIIGCYTSFFEYCFKNKNEALIKKLFPYIKQKTRRSPTGELLRWGIIFRPEDDERIIKQKLNKF
jgi:hypothetical protein